MAKQQNLQNASGEVLKLKKEIEYLSKLIGDHKPKDGFEQSMNTWHGHLSMSKNKTWKSTAVSTSTEMCPGTHGTFLKNTTHKHKSLVCRSAVDLKQQPIQSVKRIAAKAEIAAEKCRRTVHRPITLSTVSSRVVVKPREADKNDSHVAQINATRVVRKPSVAISGIEPGIIASRARYVAASSVAVSSKPCSTGNRNTLSTTADYNGEKQLLKSLHQPASQHTKQVIVSKVSVLLHSDQRSPTITTPMSNSKAASNALSTNQGNHTTSTTYHLVKPQTVTMGAQVNRRTVVPPKTSSDQAKQVTPSKSSFTSIIPTTHSTALLPSSPLKSSQFDVVSQSRYKFIRKSTKNETEATIKFGTSVHVSPISQTHRAIHRGFGPDSFHHVQSSSTPSKLEHRGKYKLVKSSRSSQKSHLQPGKNWTSSVSNFHWQKKYTSHNVPASPLVSPICPKPSTSLMCKSRYKLLKKAIEYTHRKYARQNLNQKNKFKYVSPNRESRLARSMSRSEMKNAGKKKNEKQWTRKYSLKRNNAEASGMPHFLSINQVLGRHVVNLSHDKFKFISASSRGKLNVHKQKWRHLSTKNRHMKIDRRSRQHHKQIYLHTNINQSPHRTLLRNLSARRSRYVLHRHTPSISNSTVKRIINRATKVDRTREIASRVLQKSIYTAHLAKFKKVNNKPGNKTYCLYYNRFGKCNRGTKCQYVHDPDRVAICTRFLRGRCEVSQCPFSHNVSKEKVPVCQYFIRGVCSRDNCLYLHSNVSKDAKICGDFIQGFCALGDQCKKKHSLICPEFKKDGKCPRGQKCDLRHVKKNAVKRKNIVATDSVSPKVARKDRTSDEDDFDDISLPVHDRSLPSYIALDSSLDASNTSQIIDGALLIHPRLSLGDD